MLIKYQFSLLKTWFKIKLPVFKFKTVSGGNNIYQSTPPPPPILLHPEFPALIENGAVVQPLPPEIALRLPLNEFLPSSVEVPPLPARPSLSPVRVLAESSGASSSSVTSSR
jgi:hypothetical protein